MNIYQMNNNIRYKVLLEMAESKVWEHLTETNKDEFIETLSTYHYGRVAYGLFIKLQNLQWDKY